jgi:hypothetical protein
VTQTSLVAAPEMLKGALIAAATDPLLSVAVKV